MLPPTQAEPVSYIPHTLKQKLQNEGQISCHFAAFMIQLYNPLLTSRL